MAGIYRVEFDITGKRIQKAGFRSAVENMAIDLEITGHAENRDSFDDTGMKVYSVHVVAEGSKDGMRAFIEKINETNIFHRVNKVEAGRILSSAKPAGKRKYPEFAIVRGKNEISERMDEAAYYMKHTHGEMQRMNGMLEKVEKNTSQIPDLRTEVHGMREETNKNFETMEGKYHNISENLKMFLDIVGEYAIATNPGIKGKIDAIRKQYEKA